MLHKRTSLGSRKVSPPLPTCMTKEQQASYLSNLRNNRPVRPVGSRPLPGKSQASITDNDLPLRSGSALSMRRHFEALSQEDEQQPTLSKRASMPLVGSISSNPGSKGRPLVSSLNNSVVNNNRHVSPTLPAGNEVPYKESAMRLLERQEAHELREALQTIDQMDEETRIHEAAKFEAADLVWRHQNPQLAEIEKTAAYRNPELNKKSYGEIGTQKSSLISDRRKSSNQSRSTSGGSTKSQENSRTRLPWLRRKTKRESQDLSQERTNLMKSIDDNMDEITALPQPTGRRISSGGRKVSSGSSKAVFRNPTDQIFEEPEDSVSQPPLPRQGLPLRPRNRNSLPRGSRPLPDKPSSDVERFEIWKNPPTQSRKADYTANPPMPETPVQNEAKESESPRSAVLEIRSEEIRAATSMKKKDRSPNLPKPTAVSDRVGRPIVSFDPKWRPSTDSPRGSQDHERLLTDRNSPSVPTITIQEDSRKLSNGLPRQMMSDSQPPSIPTISISSSPSIPTICFPDDGSAPEVASQSQIPSIKLADDDDHSLTALPVINVSDEQPRRPLPSITTTGARSSTRPLPSNPQISTSHKPAGSSSRVPWLSRAATKASPGASASCTACGLPISGRIVTAAGSAKSLQKARFHPECFSCHHCGTPLECVSFYPEPETARLERFQSAFSHLPPDDEQITVLADSNEDLRFFCHLDFHEMYSPRCHSCKTPVEGAVVLALGRHYHPDHFFCAECGDPFSQDSPFVEHNNYAYCVNCHTKRTSARCRSCKKQILDEMTVEALGGKWHDECFVCFECGGDFGDEGKFFVREVDMDLTEKEKRKGIGRKVEERAVCQACEEVRVKNVEVFI